MKNNFDDDLNDQDMRRNDKQRQENSINFNKTVKPILKTKTNDKVNMSMNSHYKANVIPNFQSAQAENDKMDSDQIEEVSLDTKELNQTLKDLNIRKTNKSQSPSHYKNNVDPNSIDPFLNIDEQPSHPNTQQNNTSTSAVESLRKDNDRMRKELNDNYNNQSALLIELQKATANNSKLQDKELKQKEVISELKSSIKESDKAKEEVDMENNALRRRMVKLELEVGEFEMLNKAKKDEWDKVHENMSDQEQCQRKTLASFKERQVQMDSDSIKFTKNVQALNDLVVKKQTEQGNKCISVESFSRTKLDEVQKSLTKINSHLESDTMKKQMNAVDRVSEDTRNTISMTNNALGVKMSSMLRMKSLINPSKAKVASPMR